MDNSTWGGTIPRRVDTHISTVILVGDRAYKLKKAVRFPFLDFSTLTLRKQACERELELNRAWSPSLYLGLTPITCDGAGKLAINGAGEPVEYLIVMNRFPDDGGLATLLEHGRVDRKQIAGLVQNLWDGYASAVIHRECGGAQGMGAIVDGLEKAFVSPPPARLFELWRRTVTEHAARLDQRLQAGLVRRCHGDLHVGNICQFENQLMPFDALEFNEDFATIDIVYDLAFLIMDLMAHDARDMATLVMNRYLDVSGDYQSMEVMPFFLSVRAGVRAMVMDTMGKRQQSQVYLALAEKLLQPQSPRVVAVGGLSGSGKSRLSSRVSPLLASMGAAVIRSDAIRKRLMGVAQTTKLDQSGYDSTVTRKVYDAMMEACECIAGFGLPVIADAVFGNKHERDAIEAVANRLGVPFTGLWLEAPFEIAAQRISGRKADASDATVSVLEQQRERDVGPMAWVRIQTDAPGEETVAKAMASLDLKDSAL